MYMLIIHTLKLNQNMFIHTRINAIQVIKICQPGDT